jgi:serine/threonine protein kinase/anti-anti-sigma regulatory factor
MSADRLQFLKRLASGGMAELYLARQSGLSGVEKLVVVKQILPQFAKDPEYLRMFDDEARIAAHLQHPNLVQMYELGRREGVPFMLLEYLHGEDVRAIYKVLRERGQSLRVDYALAIMVGVTAGLHYAHERTGLDGRPLNIVHRDVSPQNVVVTYEGGVKMVDFGIARAENRQNQTQNSVLKGKLPYMPPEQVAGEALDRRADVYSAGVMLYEMTTGQRPFRNQHDVALMRSILDDAVVPPQKLIPGYPVELQAVVLKALAKDRAQRFQTAQELQAALEDFARRKFMLLSSISLSKFMLELFGARAEAYREVLSGARSAEALPEPISLDEEATAPEPAPVELQTAAAGAPTSAAATALANTAHTEASRVGTVTIVKFKGKLNEYFQGADLGRTLAGEVVFDLSRVERVTSFGVREWLQLLSVAEPKLTGLYFARCSEAVVNQLSMIRRFLGPGRVLSFFATYACPHCGRSSPQLIDVATHQATLERTQLPLLPCPACGEPSEFDDDPHSYLAFGPRAGPALAATVEAAVGALSAATPAPEALEKTLEGEVTRVKLRAPLDGAVRWQRVFDGLEGQVAIDLVDSERFDDTGVRQLAAAMAGLGGEVAKISVEGAPPALAERAATLGARVDVQSVSLEGQCATCASPRRVVIRAGEVATAKAERRAPWATCRRCNAPLRFPGFEAAEAVAVAVLAPAVVAAAEPAVPLVPARHGRWGWMIGVLAAVALGLSAVVTQRLSTPAHSPPEVVPVVTPSQGAPAWVSEAPQAGELRGDGHATGPSASVDARTTAWARVARQLEHDEASKDDAFLAKVAQARLGAVEPRELGGQANGEVWVRLLLPEGPARARWASQSVCRGAHLRWAPLEAPWPGGVTEALLVEAVDANSPAQRAGVRVGDLIVGVLDQPVTSPEAAGAVCGSPELTLRVLAQGVSRGLRIGN